MVNTLCISDGVYTLFKKMFLLFDTALLKCFVYTRVGILDYPRCKNPCCAHEELGQGDFYSFDQKLINYLPTKHVTARTTILFSILSIAFAQSGHLQACKISGFLFLLLFLINYPPSKTTLRFPHSSPMNISLGKSVKFPIPSISIPSCCSSTVLTLFEGFPLQ